jgi:hypothetical protein
MMPCHEEQFDVVLVARQRLIEELKDLCKSFQVPSALTIQEPRQSVVHPDRLSGIDTGEHGTQTRAERARTMAPNFSSAKVRVVSRRSL